MVDQDRVGGDRGGREGVTEAARSPAQPACFRERRLYTLGVGLIAKGLECQFKNPN